VTPARSEGIDAAYEALRAQALGRSPAESPRGMAVVLAQGVPAWIRAWAAPASGSPWVQ
jgi:hypothetical protein